MPCEEELEAAYERKKLKYADLTANGAEKVDGV